MGCNSSRDSNQRTAAAPRRRGPNARMREDSSCGIPTNSTFVDLSSNINIQRVNGRKPLGSRDGDFDDDDEEEKKAKNAEIKELVRKMDNTIDNKNENANGSNRCDNANIIHNSNTKDNGQQNVFKNETY